MTEEGERTERQEALRKKRRAKQSGQSHQRTAQRRTGPSQRGEKSKKNYVLTEWDMLSAP
eukprot:scaffold14270_cov113-Cylindrotheca_fusiformis.AAC.2